jgi:acyl-CoA thioesterase FadM
LNVRYKKPLFTPQVVMVRGRVMKVEGRKLFVGGSIENEKGELFAEADGLWVMRDGRTEKM